MSAAGGVRAGFDKITCEAAAALALWLEHDLQQVAQEILGQRVTAVQSFGTYCVPQHHRQCRLEELAQPARHRQRRRYRRLHARRRTPDLRARPLARQRAGSALPAGRAWRRLPLFPGGAGPRVQRRPPRPFPLRSRPAHALQVTSTQRCSLTSSPRRRGSTQFSAGGGNGKDGGNRQNAPPHRRCVQTQVARTRRHRSALRRMPPCGPRDWPACRQARAGSTSARRRTGAARAAAASGRPASSRRPSPGRTRHRGGRAGGTPAAMCAGLMPGTSVPTISTGPGGVRSRMRCMRAPRSPPPCGHARQPARPHAGSPDARVGRNGKDGLPARIAPDALQQRRRRVPRKARGAGDADLARQPRLDAARHRQPWPSPPAGSEKAPHVGAAPLVYRCGGAVRAWSPRRQPHALTGTKA